MYNNSLIKSSKKRMLISIYLILTIIILYRFFTLQIIENEVYKEQAGNNSLRKIVLYPPRGIIYDRNYIHLVDNRPLYQMEIITEDMQHNFDFKILEKYTGINKTSIDSVILKSERIAGGQFKPMLLKKYIDISTKAILEEYKLDLKGLYFSEIPARIYTSDCSLAHVLGYLRKVDQITLSKTNYHYNDIIGYSGIEKYYEDKLRGSYGINYFLVDWFGVILRLYETD